MSQDDLYVPTAVAAELAGVSVRTVRRWAKAGHVPAKSGPHRLLVDACAVRRQAAIAGHGDTLARTAGDTDPALASDGLGIPARVPDDPATVTGTDPALVALIERQQQTILELSGRCGYYQSEIRHLKERIALLEVPKPDPSDPASAETANETANRSGPEPSRDERGAQSPTLRPWWAFWRWLGT